MKKNKQLPIYKKIYLLTFFSASMVILAFLFSSCSNDENGPDLSAGPPPAATEVVKGVVVEPGRLEQRLQATGTFLPFEEVLIASEIPGKVVEINFCEGCYVSKGEVLFKIDDSELNARLNKLEVDLKLSKDELARSSKLREIKAISEEDLTRSESRVATLRAEEEILQVQKQKASIRAPFSGMTGLRQISLGSYLQPGIAVTTLRQLNPIKIEFGVPERFSEYVKDKDHIWFTTSTSSDTFQATIYAIDPGINTATRSLQVRARTSNNERRFIPGGFCEIQYEVFTSNNALSVPAEAIIPELEGQKVMIMRNGAVTSVPVAVGIRTEKGIQVTEGLQPGDTVITTGLLSLNEGANVDVEVIENLTQTSVRKP